METIEACLERVTLPKVSGLQTREYREAGQYPVIDQGRDLIAGWTDAGDGVISEPLPVVVFGDHSRTFKYVDFPFVRGADGTQVLKPRENLNPLYFYFACRSVDLPSRGYNRHLALLKEQSIPVPAPSDQARIAQVLEHVDDYIRHQEAQLSAAQDLRRSVVRQLFAQGLRGDGRQETELGELPQGWDVVEFQEVRESLRYGTSARCSLETGTYPVLRIPNIGPAKIDDSELKYCDMPAREAARFSLDDGDLLFIRTNGVIERLGLCAVYRGQPKNALFASYLIRARLKDGADPDFIAYFLGSPVGIAEISARATPAADGKYNLNTGIIDSLLVPLPPIDEQHEIVNVIRSLDQKQALHREKLATSRRLFERLLRGLMTGEISAEDLALAPWPGSTGRPHDHA
jgi:type I restriction enzyme S subunit